jgi:imidazole glycerol-phosphate synthase subunit HisH
VNRVVVIDYGLGNLHSVVKALRHIGAEPAVTSDPAEVASAERVVLPGVGAFADGMRRLNERSLTPAVHRFVETQRPLLGICLGMQLLLSRSDEFGSHPGLGIVDGSVVALTHSPGLKVPQIGWNRIAPPAGVDWKGTVLERLPPGAMMYFVHSFTAAPARETDRLADTTYGGARVSAAIQRDNVVGCQFHPEKSGAAGLTILERFLET